MLVQLKLKSFGKVMKLKFGKDIAQAQAVQNRRDGTCESPLIITSGSRLLCIHTYMLGPPLFGLYPNGLFTFGLSLIGLQGYLDYHHLDYL